MHDIAPDSRLADVVTSHPPLARELERLGLDYCCGGLRKLSEACAELGLDLDRVVRDLRAAAASSVDDGPAEWALIGLSQLVDHLEATHHRYLWDELPRIARLVDEVVAAHAARHPELHAVADTFTALHAEFVPHLQKEETVLFPMIRDLATADELPSFHCGSVANPISVMFREHDQAGSCCSPCGRSPMGTGRPTTGARPTGRSTTPSPGSMPTPTCTSTRRTTCCSPP